MCTGEVWTGAKSALDDEDLRQVVTPDMVRETKWLRSPKVGDLMSRALKQISASASLSMQKVMVESSTR